MSRLIKLNPFENVVAGSTALLPRIQMGQTFEMILLKLGGTFTKAQINNIRIRLGGKLIWDVTGSDLDKINQYMGHAENAAYLPIWFAEPTAQTHKGQLTGAIDTSIPYSGFAIECDIDSGATNPTLEAWAQVSAPKPVSEMEPESKVRKLLFRSLIKSTHQAGGAGTYNLNIAKGSDGGTLLKRVFIYHDYVTQFSVKKNGLDLQDRGENGVVQFLQNELNRETQSDQLVYDPVLSDLQGDAVGTLRSNGQPANFEFNATTSAADNDIVTYADIYATIGQV